ncbi:MAG: tetratricopeptide repeat protein [Atribacterota bacterium]
MKKNKKTQAIYYWVYENEIKRAKQKYKKYLKNKNYNGQDIFSYAILCILNGEIQEAMNCFLSILKINPKDESVKDGISWIKDINLKEKTIKRSENFLFVYPSFLKEDKIKHIEYVFEFCFDKLIKETDRIPIHEYITVQIDPAYYPISRTHFIFRPLSPKITISPKNCDRSNIIHEVTHALFPSENIFLMEGLALYFQKIYYGDNGWPFNIEGFKQSSANLPYSKLIKEYIFKLKYFIPDNLKSYESVEYYKASWEFSNNLIQKDGLKKFLIFYDALSDMEEINNTEDIYKKYYKEKLDANDSQKSIKKPPKRIKHIQSDDNKINKFRKRFNKIKKEYSISKTKQFVNSIEDNFDTNNDPKSLMLLCEARHNYLILISTKTILNKNDNLLKKDQDIFLEELDNLYNDIKRGLEIEPQSVDLHLLLSDVYGLYIQVQPSNKKIEFSLKMYSELKKAKRLAPNNPYVYLAFAKTTLYTPKMFGGGEKKAQKYIEKALELEPDNLGIIAWNGLIEYRMGNIQNAIKNWKKVLKVNSNHLLAKKMLKKVSNSKKQVQ